MAIPIAPPRIISGKGRQQPPTPEPTLAVRLSEPLERARLTLHERDPITSDEDALYTLFYEHYRGYTLYSTQEGRCCIHGKQGGGCLRIEGLYVCFPDIEQAKLLVKHFQANGRTPCEGMERSVPKQAYVCLHRERAPQRHEQRLRYRLAGA